MNSNKKKYVSPKLQHYTPLGYSSNNIEIKLSQAGKLPATAKSIAS